MLYAFSETNFRVCKLDRTTQEKFNSTPLAPGVRFMPEIWINDSRTNMKSSPAWRETAKSGVEYTVRTRCPQCGRKHITAFRLRHVSDGFFVQLGHFFFATQSTLTSDVCAGAQTRGNLRTGAAFEPRLWCDQPGPLDAPTGSQWCVRRGAMHCELGVRDAGRGQDEIGGGRTRRGFGP